MRRPSGVRRGAYVLADAADGKPAVILIGTGSEVALCVEAYEQLKQEGIPARVVSMPSWELFEQQDQAYRDRVLPPDITARVSVEMGSVIGWDRYVGATGAKIGMHTFGASAPLKDLLAKFGFTPEQVIAAARDQIENAKGKPDESASEQRSHRIRQSPRPIRSRPCIEYGQAALARLPGAQLHRRRQPQEAGRARRAHRRHLQSVDLREGDRRQRRLRCVAEGDRSRGRPRCDDALRAAGDRGHPARGRCAAAGLRGDQGRRTAMSASRCRPIWRWTPRRRSPRRSGFGARSAATT